MSAYLKGFSAYLQLERHLSPASVEAYGHDVRLFLQFCAQGNGEPDEEPKVDFAQISLQQVERFMGYLLDLGMSPTSQARILAGVKSFFNYLVLEKVIEQSPAELVETPKLKRHLPDVLSYEEIEKVFSGID